MAILPLLDEKTYRYDLTGRTMKRFLIAEDYSPLFRYFEHLISLRYKGAVILRANNGKEALEKVRDSDCSVILSELALPEVDGIEFYERLKEESPLLAQRMGFISSIDSQHLMNYFKQEGLPFVGKPVKAEEFYNLIDGILMSDGKRNVGEINYDIQRVHERRRVREMCSLKPLNMDIENLIIGEITDISEGGFGFRCEEKILSDRFNVKVISMPFNIIDKEVAEVVWTNETNGAVNAGFRWAA